MYYFNYARNFCLENVTDNKYGWTIKTDHDLLTALMGRPELESVAPGFIVEALNQLDNKSYKNVDDLAADLAEHYL